jgi:hypothetical protein
MRYFVEIERIDGRYEGRLHTGDPVAGKKLRDIGLGPDALVNIDGQDYRLARVVEALVSHSETGLRTLFDERGQSEIGQFLYERLFGRLREEERPRLEEERGELRIVTEAEEIASLPWTLLFDKQVFLTSIGWSISLSSRSVCDKCELPPSPRILIVMPKKPARWDDTESPAHLQTLKEMLIAADSTYMDQNLRVTDTWQGFVQALRDFPPDIVYYYGHGSGDARTASLAFADGPTNELQEIPMLNLADVLRDVPGGKPKIVYLNCCQGNAGGIFGAGQRLSTFIPAVITNCTLAEYGPAQKQGLVILRSMLMEAEPPHAAVTRIRTHMSDFGLTYRDVAWLTPVLHSSYGEWKANPPGVSLPKGFARIDPHWNLKLNRTAHYGAVFANTTKMLKEKRPTASAFIWYGEAEQGVDLFHERISEQLKSELQEIGTKVRFYEVKPEWPALQTDKFSDELKNVFEDAFSVAEFERIPDRIRTKMNEATGDDKSKPILLYVRHSPVTSRQLFNEEKLKDYLDWWDWNFVRLLKKDPELQQIIFALVGVSFIVDEPDEFKNNLDRKIHYELENSSLEILPKMDRLERLDLINFMRNLNIEMPASKKEATIRKILEETNGRYDKVLKALLDIQSDI